MHKLMSLMLVSLIALVIGACENGLTTPADQSSMSELSLAKQTVGANAKSLGKITLDTDVSPWWLGLDNGEFIVAESQGVELGLRAHKRILGLLGVTGDKGNRIAVYEAPTGPSIRFPEDNNGTWNYDWHVNVANAKGRYAGKKLSDYRLVLEQDFTEQSLFETPLFPGLGSDPVELPLAPGWCDVFIADELCQQSWNPGFGNTDYNPNEERTYNLRLVLTPETFNGNPLAVTIRVIVSDPS